MAALEISKWSPSPIGGASSTCCSHANSPSAISCTHSRVAAGSIASAKIKTRELTGAFEKTGALPAEKPVISTDEADLYTDAHNAAELRKAGANGTLGSWIKAHLSRSESGDYVALLAYIARDPGTIGSLQKMRLAVRDTRHVATCGEFGPRFLHSTGQAYKGGPDSGVFLQITADDAEDLPVPHRRRVSASSRRRRRAAISTYSPNVGGARYASISRATSDRDCLRFDAAISEALS